MTAATEPSLAELKQIRTDLYKQECTLEVAQRIKAIEVQIERVKGNVTTSDVAK